METSSSHLRQRFGALGIDVGPRRNSEQSTEAKLGADDRSPPGRKRSAQLIWLIRYQRTCRWNNTPALALEQQRNGCNETGGERSTVPQALTQ